MTNPHVEEVSSPDNHYENIVRLDPSTDTDDIRQSTDNDDIRQSSKSEHIDSSR